MNYIPKFLLEDVTFGIGSKSIWFTKKNNASCASKFIKISGYIWRLYFMCRKVPSWWFTNPAGGSERWVKSQDNLSLVLVNNKNARVQSHFHCVRLFATLRTAAHQVPLSMGFSRQKYWSGLPFPPPGDLPDPGIKPMSPALAHKFFTTSTTRETLSRLYPKFIIKSYRYFKNQMRCGGLPGGPVAKTPWS